MAQCQIPLPLETTLRLTIAHLEWECALLRARLLEYERTSLLQQAEMRYRQTTMTLLQPVQPDLPVPLEACIFDAEQGCLVYDVPEASLPVPMRAYRVTEEAETGG